jgi:hypothetical protein
MLQIVDGMRILSSDKSNYAREGVSDLITASGENACFDAQEKKTI